MVPIVPWNNRRALRYAGMALAVPVAAAATYAFVSHAVFRRSNMGTAAELYMRAKQANRLFKDSVALDNRILECAETNERRYALPSSVTLQVAIDEEMVRGSQVFHLNRRAINDRAVIYLHGGAYLEQPAAEHWKFLDTLAHRTRAEVIVPLYPLFPLHGVEEAYPFLEEVYRSALDKYGPSNVTLMGDSAGGGLAAGFAEHLPSIGLEQPSHLVLISPWVDVTLGNPDIVHFEASDPMLGVQGLQKLGIGWAKGIDAYDYRVSPVNGEVRNLRNVVIFVGTREIFYPDVKLFYDRINASGVHADLYVGRGLNHVYPLYPIPEAKSAMEIIVDAVCTD